MIFDEFKNLKIYGPDSAVCDFILNLDPKLPAGRHYINENAYINIDEYQTKNEIKFEAHRKYIDIQFLIKGREIIYTTPISGLLPQIAYSEEKDLIFYTTPNAPLNTIYLEPGDFVIFYPNDAHAPCINFNGKNEPVKKAVVKIKIN